MRTKNKKPSPDGAVNDDRKAKKPQRRPETRRRIRKIVERHRETFDELAK